MSGRRTLSVSLSVADTHVYAATRVVRDRSVRRNIPAIDPSGREIAVARSVMPNLAPAVTHRSPLPCRRLAGDIQKIDAAGAFAGHLQHGAVRIGCLLLRLR